MMMMETMTDLSLLQAAKQTIGSIIETIALASIHFGINFGLHAVDYLYGKYIVRLSSLHFTNGCPGKFIKHLYTFVLIFLNYVCTTNQIRRLPIHQIKNCT